MAAIKTMASSNQSAPQYHTTDAHNNHIALVALGSTGNITLGSASNFLVLNKQAVADLLAALTAYSTTGVLT
jgi:hypothetical protein